MRESPEEGSDLPGILSVPLPDFIDENETDFSNIPEEEEEAVLIYELARHVPHVVALYGGRDFSITHFWKLHGGISLGVASRHETFTLPDFDDPRRKPTFPTPYQQTDDGPRFQGSIRLALEYDFSKLCSAHLGYRFSYVEDLRDFDSMPIHQAQIGMRFRL